MTDETRSKASLLLNDGVGHDFASAEQLAQYKAGQDAVARMQLSPLVNADNPREKLYIAAFDGTNNNKYTDPAHATNVAKIDDQIKAAMQAGHKHVYSHYVPGPGTQANKFVAALDSMHGFSYESRLKDMYEDLARRVDAWKQADPNAVIRLQSLGFSRGASQAAGFARMVHDLGIPDLNSRIVAADGSFSYARHHVAPGEIVQSVGLFDPVATGAPMAFDRRLPSSVVSALQITAMDEHRALFPSDQILPPGLSQDGRFLNLSVHGAHSDAGGGYLRDGLSARAGNLMIDFCNAACDKPFLQRLPEPTDPQLNVIHRSTEGNVLFRLDPRVAIRGEPSGTNLRLAPEAPPLIPYAGRALGVAAVAYDIKSTGTEVWHQVDQHNATGAQSHTLHFAARNLGMLGGARLGARIGAMAGVESGPGAVATSVLGGVVGGVGGDALLSAVDRARIYTQTAPDGVRWQSDPEHPERGWTHQTQVLDTHASRLNDGFPIYTTQVQTADPALASRLDYQASTVALELALARPPLPRDPYTQPALSSDTPSQAPAPWTRDPDTLRWTREVTYQVLEHGVKSSHLETADPQRTAQLEQAAQQTIAENLTMTPRAMVEQYQATYTQQQWQAHGPMPAVASQVLHTPDPTLLASDGYRYTRGDDGQWSAPGQLFGSHAADAAVRRELEATDRVRGATPVAHTGEEPVRQSAPATVVAEERPELAVIKQYVAAVTAGDRDGMRATLLAFADTDACRQIIVESKQRVAEHQQQLPGRDGPLFNQALQHLEKLGPQVAGYGDRAEMERIAGAVACEAACYRLPSIDNIVANPDGRLMAMSEKMPAFYGAMAVVDPLLASMQPLDRSFQQLSQEMQRQDQQAMQMQQQRDMSAQQGMSR